MEEHERGVAVSTRWMGGRGGEDGRKPGNAAWRCECAMLCSARRLVVLHDEALAKATRLQPSPSIDGLGTAMTARTIQRLMDDPFPGARSNYFVCFLFAKDNYFVVSTPHKNLDALPTRNDGVIRRLRWSWRCSHPLICCWRECSMVLFFSETNELFFW